MYHDTVVRPNPLLLEVYGPAAEITLALCSAGAHFQEHSAAESDGAQEESDWKSNMFVGVRHINLATAQKGIDGHSDNSQEQTQPHASGGKQQRGEQHTRRRGEGNGEPAALLYKNHESLSLQQLPGNVPQL